MINASIKTAVVTGASQGIGFAIANYLAKNDYQLLLISRNHTNLIAAAETITTLNTTSRLPEIAAIDVGDYNDVKLAVDKFIEKHGHIDLLCNNAGYVKRGTSELAPDEFIKMIQTNLVGTFNFIETVTPSMKSRKSGRIINIASRSGKIARKQLGGYAASKFGVMGLNEALYKELAADGIYVTAICPGLVSTEMTADVNMDKNEMIQTEDIVKTIEYLLSVSPSVAIKEIQLDCKTQLISEA